MGLFQPFFLIKEALWLKCNPGCQILDHYKDLSYQYRGFEILQY